VTKLWTLLYAVRFSVGTGDCAVVRKVDRHLCSGHWVLSPGVKQSGFKFADCTPPSHKVTNDCSCTLLHLQAFMLFTQQTLQFVFLLSVLSCCSSTSDCANRCSVPCCDCEFILKISQSFTNLAMLLCLGIDCSEAHCLYPAQCRKHWKCYAAQNVCNLHDEMSEVSSEEKYINEFHVNIQSVPRSKHTPSRLHKPVS
jgi:hypothetical protein